MRRFFVKASTLFGVGNYFAPGTLASAITVIFIFLLKFFLAEKIYILLFVFISMISFYIVEKALNFFDDKKDPQQIVLDEVVGCLITFINIPNSIINLILGFILFRFFDISKILGISSLQNLPRSAGIFFDDILAGIYSNLILQILILNSWI
ncbi:phosphatidylglycerophosphatase A [Candidatus Dependentiae bacterium]|nr:phosphatidylglycerophosphatase A [Candidatus Dependentiae bacterium]